MRFLTPLRKPTAVLLSLALLPWQPLAASAVETAGATVPVPASFTSEDARVARELRLDLAKPKESLEQLTKGTAERLAELRRDDLPARDAAGLAAAFTALKARFPDRQLPLTSLSPAARPVVDAYLAGCATHYALVSAVLERGLPAIRADLVTARDGLALLDKPRAQRAEADWVALESAVEPVAGAVRSAKDALRRARDMTPAVDRAIAVEFESLLDALRETHRRLESRHARADFAAELAARPRGEADAAARELLSAAAAPLAGRPELQTRLAGAQASLSLFLRSGDEAQLGSAIAEMARVYDAAGVSREEQARIFARVGGSAAAKSARANAEAATLSGRVGEPTASAAAALLTGQARVLSDLRSARTMPDLRAERPEAAPDALPSGPTALERLAPAFDAVLAPLDGLALDATSPLHAALDALPGSDALAGRLATAARELDRRGLLAESDAVTAALLALPGREEAAQDRASIESLLADARAALARADALAGRPGFTPPPGLLSAAEAARGLVARLAARTSASAAAVTRAREEAARFLAERADETEADWSAAWSRAGVESDRAASGAAFSEDAAGARAAWAEARTALAARWRQQAEADLRRLGDDVHALVLEAPEPGASPSAQADFAGRWTALLARLREDPAEPGRRAEWEELKRRLTAMSAPGGPLEGFTPQQRERTEGLVRLALWLADSGRTPMSFPRGLRATFFTAAGGVDPNMAGLMARDEQRLRATLETQRRMPALLERLARSLDAGEDPAAFFDGAEVRALLDADPGLRGMFDQSDYGRMYQEAVRRRGQPREAADAVALLRRGVALGVAADASEEPAQLEARLQFGFGGYAGGAYAFLSPRRDRAGFDGPAVRAFLAAWEGRAGEPDLAGEVRMAELARAAIAGSEARRLTDLRVEMLRADRRFEEDLGALSPERIPQIEAQRAAVAAAREPYERDRADAATLERAIEQNAPAPTPEVRRILAAFQGVRAGRVDASLDALRAAQEALSARAEAGLRGMEERDAGLRRELAQARDGQRALAELSAYLRRNGLIAAGEEFSVEQLRAVSRNAAAVELARQAYDYMQSVEREAGTPTPAQLESLRSWWRAIREAALASIGRGDYAPPAAARLAEWTGGDGQDAAALESLAGGLLVPGVVTRAFLDRVKALRGAPREGLPASAQPLLDWWAEFERGMTESAGALERQADALARQRGFLSSTDASAWQEGRLDEARVAFLRGTLRDGATRPVAELAAEWRSILAAGGPGPQAAAALERLAAEEARVRALVADIRVGLALEDAAASLAALGRVRAALARDGSPGFEVLDAAWAATAAADPAAVRRLGERFSEGARDRLLLTSLDQFNDLLRRQVGEHLPAFLRDRRAARGAPGTRLLERLAESFADKRRLQDDWAALAGPGGPLRAEDLQDGERLFLQLQRSGAEIKTVFADHAGYMPASLRSLGLDYAPFVRAVNPEIVSLRYAASAPVLAGPGAGSFGPGVLVQTRLDAPRRHARSAPPQERLVFTALGGERRLVREAVAGGGYAEYLRPASEGRPAVKVYLDLDTGRAYERGDDGALRSVAGGVGGLARVYSYAEERLTREPATPGGSREPRWDATRRGEYATTRALRLDHDGARLSLVAHGVSRLDAETGATGAATVTIDDLGGVEMTEWASRRSVTQTAAGVTTFYAKTAGAWTPTRRLSTDETRDAGGAVTRRPVVEVYSGPGLWIKYGRVGSSARETGAPLGASLETPRWRGSEAARQRIITDAASRAAAALQRRMPLAQAGSGADVTALTADYFRRFFDGDRESRGFVGIGADRSIFTRGPDGVERVATHRLIDSGDSRGQVSLLTVMGLREGRVTGIESALVQGRDGRITVQAAESFRHVESNVTGLGWLLGRTHTDRTQISVGGRPLVLEDKEVRFNQRGGGVLDWFHDYGLLGIVTLQPATDWVGYGVEVGLIAAGVPADKARFFGELTAGALDFVAGMATMGPGLARLWTVAKRYNTARAAFVAGTTAMAGYGLYATGRAAFALNDAVRSGDWSGAGIALRGIVGNLDMILSPFGSFSFQGARMSFKFHGVGDGGFSFREVINPPEAPRPPPEPRPADAPPPPPASPRAPAD
ncbi:MAG: hypothetical protein SF051_16705, partial [Elusimicrobiota bacterium]|nr:hypothetical protein [Elusimicrobiota bacterium]